MKSTLAGFLLSNLSHLFLTNAFMMLNSSLVLFRYSMTVLDCRDNEHRWEWCHSETVVSCVRHRLMPENAGLNLACVMSWCHFPFYIMHKKQIERFRLPEDWWGFGPLLETQGAFFAAICVYSIYNFIISLHRHKWETQVLSRQLPECLAW